MEMPLSSSTSPCPALCTGLMERSAAFTSQTCEPSAQGEMLCTGSQPAVKGRPPAHALLLE